MNSFVLVKVFHRGIWTEIKGKCSSFIFVGDYFTLQTLLISVGANMCTFLPDIDNSLYLVRKIEIRKRNFLFLLSVFESGKTKVGGQYVYISSLAEESVLQVTRTIMYTVRFIPLQTQYFFKTVEPAFHFWMFSSITFWILKTFHRKTMFTFNNLKPSTSAYRTLQQALTTFGYMY